MNGNTYTATATQPTSYPTLSSPAAGATWGTASANSVSWTGGAPVANTSYLLGALDANDPAGGAAYFQALALSANTYSIPAYSLTPGNKDLIIGITNAAPVGGASATSDLVVGGFNYVPIVVNQGATPPPKTLVSLAITGAPSLVAGTTAQLNATGTYSDNSTQDLTNQVTWSALNPAVAAVGAGGLVSGVATGTAAISASLGNVVGTTSVTVYQILPLAISSVTPASGVSAVSVYSKITATFNQAVTLNAALLSGAYFSLTQNGIPVAGTLMLDNTYTTLTFLPSAGLLPNTQYVATVTTGPQNQLGATMASNYSWSFTTENAPFKDYVSQQTDAFPEAIAIGDVNGDGRNDVVMTTSVSRPAINNAPAYKVVVYLQDATGNLLPPVMYATGGSGLCPLSAVDIGDVNGDGRKDVVVGTATCGVDVLLQAADGTLQPRVHYASTDANKIRIADVNKDGRMDVVGVGAWGDNFVSVWLQDQAGNLTAPARYSVQLSGAVDLEVGDTNHDGLPDIVVMSAAWGDPDLEVLTQTASGTFKAHVDYNIGATPNVSSVALGDINGDNLIDAVVTYSDNISLSRIGVFLQNGQGTFNSEVGHLSADIPEAAAIADVNNDGRNDVIVLHNGSDNLGVYEQLADGTLQVEHLYRRPVSTSFNPQSLAVGDINGDGKVDAVSVDTIYGLVINYHY